MTRNMVCLILDWLMKVISSLIFETARQLKATFESFHVIRAKVDFSFKFTIIGKFLN